jgi:hypothetical protein
MADARLVSPVLYEVRASVLLESVAADAAQAAADAASSGAAPAAAATLADVPPAYFLDLRRAGVDVLYLLGVWTVGAAGVAHSVDKLGPERAGLAVSSPFAVCDYHVDPAFGGDDALRTLKAAANAAGLRVMVDFVPNHLARDHRCVRARRCPGWLAGWLAGWLGGCCGAQRACRARLFSGCSPRALCACLSPLTVRHPHRPIGARRWTLTKPWLFVQGTDADAARHRDRYFQVTVPASSDGTSAAASVAPAASSQQQPTLEPAAATQQQPQPQQLWLAHGRDPYSGGWHDTVQLNYRHPQLRGIMKAILVWCVRRYTERVGCERRGRTRMCPRDRTLTCHHTRPAILCAGSPGRAWRTACAATWRCWC